NSSGSSRTKLTTRNLIILTYMRCGSSFTGNIIQESPDVFYFFEPFRDLMTHLADLHTPRTDPVKEEAFQLYVQTMKTILGCRFEDVDNITLQVGSVCLLLL
ncbi:unnamed protein product, partial [Candidula unifasciata]